MVDLNKTWFSDIREMKINVDVEGLIQVLKHDDDFQREAAAWVLGEIGDKKAINELVKHSLNDVSYVRREAFRALVTIAGDDLPISMKVPKSPTYMCSLDIPPESIEWPPNCCICLSPPEVLKETLCKGLYTTQIAPTYTRYASFIRVTRVPYCQNCLRKTKKRFFSEKEGVEIELIIGDSRDELHVIRATNVQFRNPLYAKKFLELNNLLG